MENFTKNSLKAAVAKYGPLHTDGKAEADVKSELTKDERAFTAEQIDEIYAAIIAPPDLLGEGNDPKQIETQLIEAKTPEWVQTILDSNQALLDSNQSVLSALDAFKENSADFVKQLVKEFAKPTDGTFKEAKPTAEYVEAVGDAKYEVAAGKEFRHPNDFNIKYTEGDDISHLPTSTLTRLLNSGLIVES